MMNSILNHAVCKLQILIEKLVFRIENQNFLTTAPEDEDALVVGSASY